MHPISDDFVAAMLSAVANQRITTVENFEKMKNEKSQLNGQPLDLETLHNSLFMKGRVGSPVENNEFQIFVKILDGRTITVDCISDDTTENLKDLIAAKSGLRPDQQRLMFNCKELRDGETLESYNIGRANTVHVLSRLRGAGDIVFYLDSNLRDPAFDYDFTNISDVGVTFKRGGHIYQRPIGSTRVALNVVNLYEDNKWLGHGKTRQAREVNGEWAVSYHGTATYNLKGIAQEGYQFSRVKRIRFGRGIYTTPFITTAMKFARRFTYQDQAYKAVLQNRVNPKSFWPVYDSETGEGEYWISEYEGDVRPYGICYMKC